MRTARARADAIVAVAALVIAVVYYLLAREIPESLLGDSVGAAGLPNVYAALLALVAVLLMVQAWRAPHVIAHDSEEDGAGSGFTGWQHLRALGLLLPGIAYLVLIGFLGYGVTVGLLILAIALYSGARFGWRLVAISIAGAFGLWITFVLLFNVPLPSGSLWQGLLHR